MFNVTLIIVYRGKINDKGTPYHLFYTNILLNVLRDIPYVNFPGKINNNI